MSTPSFVKNVLKSIDNKYASVASAGMFSDISDEFIDSGSYVVNALVSGSIYGGFPANKVSAIAGESSTGKTFFVMTTAHEFQKKHDKGIVFYFDTEGAITTEMLDNKGLDKDRFVMVPVGTLDEFKFQCIKVLDEIEKIPGDERPKVLLILDSLGNLATEKEMGDARAEKSTADMTRGRSIRSIFRTLTLMMSRLNIPMIVTNHTYTTMSLYSEQAMGGTGLRYAASTILFLSKRKERDDNRQVIGNVVHVKTDKSRLTKEAQMVDTVIFFSRGMDRYYGLGELAVEAGVFKKVSTRIELPDGKKVFMKQIIKNPKEFFTQEILDQIDAFCKTKFCYGTDSGFDDMDVGDEELEETTE